MKYIFLLFPFIIYTQLGAQQLDIPKFHSDRIIVKFKPELLRVAHAEQKIDEVIGQIASLKEQQKTFARTFYEPFRVIHFEDDIDIQYAVDKLNALDLVEFAEPDYIGTTGGELLTTLPDDTHFDRQWALQNEGYFEYANARFDSDIDITEAWDITQGDSNVVVAFLDTGLKLNHPEFVGRLWRNKNEIENNFQDDDKNGYGDDHEGGWDFVNTTPIPIDDHGHGTNVTGIYGANGNNGNGYAGIDWYGKIMVLKVIDENNYGSYSTWASAIYYATDNGADIINMSIGGIANSQALRDAVIYAYDRGVTLVACSMNTNSDWVFYPAGFPEVIAVGSTNPNDERTVPFFWDEFSGSNFGDHLDIVAPGNYIFGLSYYNDNNFGSYWGGTSQAVPHVVGVAALLLAKDSTLSHQDIRSILRSTAEDRTGNATEDVDGFDIYHGYGRLNALNALSSLDQTTSNEIIDNPAFVLFPNPVPRGSVQIQAEFTDIENLSWYNIEWYDALGRMISRIEEPTNNVIPIPLNSRDSNILFCKIYSNKGPFIESILFE